MKAELEFSYTHSIKQNQVNRVNKNSSRVPGVTIMKLVTSLITSAFSGSQPSSTYDCSGRTQKYYYVKKLTGNVLFKLFGFTMSCFRY